MQPTFGDFDERAREHLAAALDLAQRPFVDERSWNAWHGCLNAVVRLIDLSIEGPSLNHRRHSSVEVTAARLRQGVEQARSALADTPTRLDERFNDPLAQRLTDAASCIGAGCDLLTTHNTTNAAGSVDRSDYASMVDSEAGRAQLVITAAGYATALSDIAEGIPPTASMRRSNVGRAVEPIRAATVGVAALIVPPSTAYLRSVPLLEPLTRHPAQPGETPAELMANAVRNAEQLHLMSFRAAGARRPGQHTVGVLGNLATTLAALHHSSSRILGAFATGSERDPVGRAAEDAVRSATRWMDVRHRWHGTAGTVDPGSHAPARQEAGDLMMRLGRLAHGDDWQPCLGSSAAIRPLDEIAPNPEARAALFEGLHHLSVLSSLMAGEHASIVADLASIRQLLVPTSTLPPSDQPQRPWSKAPDVVVDRLIDGYRAARDSAAATAASLEPLAGVAHDQSALRERIALAAHRGRRVSSTQPVRAVWPVEQTIVHGIQR